jgi:hypothetical protein
MDYDRGESKVDYSSMDPEQRIAMLKAQKEKEKEREIAEKEMQVRIFVALIHFTILLTSFLFR